MQNLEIVGIVNAYTAQRGKEGIRLPAPVAWKRRVNLAHLMKTKEIIDEAIREVSDRYTDDEHSTPGENGTRMVKPEYMTEFLKAHNEIMVQETDVDIRKIKIEELGDVNLNDAEMDTIAFMIEEE